ncbi:MAG: hypothetical protein ACTS27_03935, partial [Phycisphaerales bacterium]
MSARGLIDGVSLFMIVTAAHFGLGVAAGLIAQRSAGHPLDLSAATLPGALAAGNIAFTGLAFAAFRGGDWRRALPRIYGVVGIGGGGTGAFPGPVAW